MSGWLLSISRYIILNSRTPSSPVSETSCFLDLCRANLKYSFDA